jgi:hypothetical protein
MFDFRKSNIHILNKIFFYPILAAQTNTFKLTYL